MSQIIYFVTEPYLKLNTPVTANIDIVEILPLIKGAALMWTRSTLGTYFFNDLLTKYNDQTLSADEVTLVEYMQPAIAWRTCSDSVATLSYQLKNKGIQTQSGDFSQSPEYKANMFMITNYNKKAEFYENYLWKYLVKNKDLYPNFTSHLNQDSDIICSLYSGGKFNSQIILI